MNAALKGLSYEPIPGNGPSLFGAIGLYMDHDAESLKNNVAAYLETNASEFAPYYKKTKETREMHITDLRAGGEWGDRIEIEVIQQFICRPIIIITPDTNPIVPTNVDKYSGLPVFIYYRGDHHFDAFTIEGDANPSVILANIQKQIKLGNLVTFTPTPDVIQTQPKPSSSTQAPYRTLGQSSLTNPPLNAFGKMMNFFK